MKALFYPGCTLKTSAGYEESINAVNRVLEVGWPEVDDWNCCGATAYFSLDELVSLVLPARNIAKADMAEADWVVTPCNACYATLRKAKEILAEELDKREKVKIALSEESLSYRGRVKIKHILDYYLLPDVFERVKSSVVKPLSGLSVACYYGCQYTRPVTPDVDDSAENPTKMDLLMKALGADVVDFTAKTYCCGAAQMVTHEEACLRLVGRIAADARNKGADVIVTLCPLCHFNLELGESKLDAEPVPVMFFTQLMGLAFGLSAKELGLKKLLIPADRALAKI